MSAPALAGAGRPTLRIGGTDYPVLLPRLRDPRLHLAFTITSLQVLGQVAFDFNLSIAQILVSLMTAALVEVPVAFFRQRVILWPASALLTGNGVAFILRVPGTEHGDWWSLNGWWIFAGTTAVALLSKHLIRFRGAHIFNPSNFGLVLCFLLLGPERADPLAFWWGPMSPWMALALAIIVTGGLVILSRVGLLAIAVTFWLTFGAGIAVLALSGHEMYARWHLGPISGPEFWRVLLFSPEVLVFLFFMITDPKTVPAGARTRRAYAAAVALLAVLLISSRTTEFATKVALLAALTIACAAHPLLEVLGTTRLGAAVRSTLAGSRGRLVGTAAAGATAFLALVVVVGIPARPEAAVAASSTPGTLPGITVARTPGVATGLDAATARRITRDLVSDLALQTDALRTRDRARAADGATGPWLADLWRRIGTARGGELVVPTYDVEHVRLTLEPADGQGQPTVVARLEGKVSKATYGGSPLAITRTVPAAAFEQVLELAVERGRYVVSLSRSATGGAVVAPGTATVVTSKGFGGVALTDVASQVGLDFHHGAFRFGPTTDPTAAMGGGACWLDYDGDGWLDLFVVNSYADPQTADWLAHGGLPRSALFHNDHGRFTDVSRGSGADLAVRGDGCVAADFDLDGRTDLFVTTAGFDLARNAFDALLWNNGDGTFTEGAARAGITGPGWHTGATVGDVNGDGLPDLFVAGYTDVNALAPGSIAGFPANHLAVRDRLYLNQGRGPSGHVTFREVGKKAGIEKAGLDHGLGASFTDANGDGRLDLLVANDLDPNSLYLNIPVPGGAKDDPAGLGFRLVDEARRLGVDDANAGMGVATADYSGDGRPDLFVANNREQLHAVYRSAPPAGGRPAFTDARADVANAVGQSTTGWGVSWLDLDLDTHLDLALADGVIPVLHPALDARRVQVLQNLAGQGSPGVYANAGKLVGMPTTPRANGRGLAAADFDNDGDLDLALNSVGGRLVLLRNSGSSGHWLEVRLHRFAPGTVVTITLPGGRTLVRELHAGSSYLSSEDPRAHFGLGSATTVPQVVVRRPDGSVTRLHDVATDRLVDVP